jgi:SAM-dependent methyltransferase
MTERPNYGVDAPGLVRGFAAAGGLGLAAGGVASVAGWPGWVVGWAGAAGAYCLGMAAFMLYSSRVGKLRERERLLDLLPWAGTETVLDVGCGRGLMLVGAARRLTGGKAFGIDRWQAEDQSGNRPEATCENARREGVVDRVEVVTGDMRSLPFPDGHFDAIVSHWAVHNLYAPADRATALGEMARVLKPGGRLVLADIQHHAEYAARLVALGLADVRRVRAPARELLSAAVSWGNFVPSAVTARKPG